MDIIYNKINPLKRIDLIFIMATTNTTTMILAPGEKLLRTDCDENKIPYVMCQVEVKNGKKEIRGSTIPNGWSKWDYEKCMKYNQKRADPKCTIMNINLKKGNRVIVDIDGGDNIPELLETYGNQFVTKSMNKRLPHIWFKKQDDDPYTTKTKVGGDDVDYLYQNVFEKVDSVITNYSGGILEFDWAYHIGEPKPKAKKKRVVTPKEKDIVLAPIKLNQMSHPMLEIIDDKYWENYADWFKLLSAIKNEFEDYENVATHYCCVGEYQNCEDVVIEKLKEIKSGAISMGTIHHYAKLSNPNAYLKMLIPKIENDDHGIAELFLNVFGENIVKDFNEDTYVYYRGNWRKHNKDQASLLKALLAKITLPVIEDAIEKNKAEIEQTDSVSKREELDAYEKRMKQTRACLRSSKGIDAVYKKIIASLSMRDNSSIMFDIGKDQLYHIHFKNGVYDLKAMAFRGRTREDYITQTLEYDYFEQQSEDNMKFVENIYNKLQPNKDQHLFTMEWLASHLDGNISKEKFKMNVGVGSNGKTMEFSIHNKALSIYCKKFNNEVFNKDFTKQHKEYYDLSYKPIRLAYIEELDKSKKLNIDKMKDFITGKKLPLEIMYGTQKTIDTQATLNICSNSDPNAETDGGILRRGLLQRYESVFIDDLEEDDWESNRFIKEEGIDDSFDNDEMKLAYFHVMLKYYNPTMKINASIKNAFKETLEEYDIPKQVFEKYFEKDTYSRSRTHKDDVTTRFEAEGIKDWRTILNEMKRMGYKYDKNLRVQGHSGRGVFIGLKLKDEEEDVDDI